MKEFLDQMAELLEVDSVQPTDKFTEFEAWDSLTQLSIIALASETYGVTLSAQDIINAETIEGLKKLLDKSK